MDELINEAIIALKNEKNIKYIELEKICDQFFGYTYGKRSSGSSHTIYKTPWPGDPRINIQKDGKMAKPYQVKQIKLALIKLQNHLQGEENEKRKEKPS